MDSSMEYDNTSCPHQPNGIQDNLNSWQFIPLTIILAVINLVMIGGNSLVIVAVFTSKKLWTITNTYIVSLAFSDLLLGILVLPFSAINEVSS